MADLGFLVPLMARHWGIPMRLEPGANQVALTFDDGPHPVGTPAALEALATANTTATFFLVGERVRAEPALAREIVDAGHRVALHCDRHRNALRLTGAQLRDDIAAAHATIADATGVSCTLQRAPLGIYTPAFVREVRSAGLTPWLWSKWGRDWRRKATAETIAVDATADLTDGDVLLLHDGDDYSAAGSHLRTVAALPAILNAVEARNLAAVALPI
ncbi:MAG: polysaccharide deacetylase family protein [Actinomycetes bacterium]